VGEFYEVHEAIRYIYPEQAVPIKQMVSAITKDPTRVRPIFGAIGFDFIRLVYFEIDNGDMLRHIVAEPETYYWGDEISIEEALLMNGLEEIDEVTNYERFVYTSWGAFIPLKSNELVLPYPELPELPADMRLDL
jgi:hypothetical protein